MMLRNLLDSMRETGRTERMLRHAEELAREGRAVYVLSSTTQDAKHLEERFGVAQAQALGVKFEPLPKSFFQDGGRIRGSHPNCVFLVDHYAIELHYAKQLEMLHRYDSPTRVFNP